MISSSVSLPENIREKEKHRPVRELIEESRHSRLLAAKFQAVLRKC